MKCLMRGIAGGPPGRAHGGNRRGDPSVCGSRALFGGSRLLRSPASAGSFTTPNILHYGSANDGPELKEGMIFTIEPMINLGRPHVKVLSDGWTALRAIGPCRPNTNTRWGVTGGRLRDIHALTGRSLQARHSRRGRRVTKTRPPNPTTFSTPRTNAVFLPQKRPREPRNPRRRRQPIRTTTAIGTAESPLREHGDAALADYELLELILFRSYPARYQADRQALLDRFGTLAAVFGAPLHSLQGSQGVESPSRSISARRDRQPPLLRSELRNKQVLSSWSAVIDIGTRRWPETKEQFRILFLDKPTR